jgi:hypothetical protein
MLHYRDDLVFFIYLYQRWIYRTDHTRVNEYGQTSQLQEDAVQKDTPNIADINAAAAASTASADVQQHPHSS